MRLPKRPNLRIVRFLTHNLAMLERSSQAPFHWEQSHTEAALRDLVLEVAPDIVCWQELPNLLPYVETLTPLKATTLSHHGNIATLVTHAVAAREPKVQIVEGAAVLATFDDALTIANVHLAPGRGGADQRVMQIAQIVEASPTLNLLIVGDTNMRVEEAALLLDSGFTGTKPPSATWDSKANPFRLDMPGFRAYFTRWFASPGLEVSDVVVHRKPVTFDDARFHLSDHYALSGQITLP